MPAKTPTNLPIVTAALKETATSSPTNTSIVTSTSSATLTPVATSTPEATLPIAKSEQVNEINKLVPEFPVQEIELAGPVADGNAEISGLAWYSDTLILMPQYPKFDRSGNFYALPKVDIEAYLAGTSSEPLAPLVVPVKDDGLAQQIDGFEGYEAIAFCGDRIYLTVEASGSDGMRGYLVQGYIEPDLSQIVMDTARITEILPQANVGNKADEALLIDGETLITLYEVNGVDINSDPVAHRFASDLSLLDTIPFPNIEYRITDATMVDENGRFWVINYFYPGDSVLQTDEDPLREGGWGATHLVYEQVERLVELQLTGAEITLTDTPPVLLALPSDEARNWEGLVRFNEGFLMATDKFPTTILAYVAK